ncbi:30S ribosomal protein S8e [Candidatus Woesearchaeota archaeon]|nr:30S ribosomal protein S8e [Candidatus Woesearchaeota archaeon]
MAKSQRRSLRKPSGGRYHYSRTKKNYELGGFPASTKLSSEKKVITIRTLGGNKKQVNLSINIVSVADKKGKTIQTEILNVIENPANPQLVIRNVITKGAIVETKLGKARITSRPGQEGTISGILI